MIISKEMQKLMDERVELMIQLAEIQDKLRENDREMRRQQVMDDDRANRGS